MKRRKRKRYENRRDSKEEKTAEGTEVAAGRKVDCLSVCPGITNQFLAEVKQVLVRTPLPNLLTGTAVTYGSSLSLERTY